MISPDSLGYKCCEPPYWLSITTQAQRYIPDSQGGRPLEDKEVQATVDYMLAGHSSEEAAKHFERDASAIRARMRVAGYVYDRRSGQWRRLA